jgi:hypothetical protein
VKSRSIRMTVSAIFLSCEFTCRRLIRSPRIQLAGDRVRSGSDSSYLSARGANVAAVPVSQVPRASRGLAWFPNARASDEFETLTGTYQIEPSAWFDFWQSPDTNKGNIALGVGIGPDRSRTVRRWTRRVEGRTEQHVGDFMPGSGATSWPPFALGAEAGFQNYSDWTSRRRGQQ